MVVSNDISRVNCADDWIDLPEDEVCNIGERDGNGMLLKDRGVYASLLKNPERYTGYRGASLCLEQQQGNVAIVWLLMLTYACMW